MAVWKPGHGGGPPPPRERCILDIYAGAGASGGARVFHLLDASGRAAEWRGAILAAKAEALAVAGELMVWAP